MYKNDSFEFLKKVPNRTYKTFNKEKIELLKKKEEMIQVAEDLKISLNEDCQLIIETDKDAKRL